MHTFFLDLRLDGTMTVEDPKCPSSWMGSHVYDIEVRAWCDAEMIVNAESEADARRVAEEYEYNCEQKCPLEEIKAVIVKSIEAEPCEQGEQNAGLVEVSFGDADGYDEDYGPDPDEIYYERKYGL